MHFNCGKKNSLIFTLWIFRTFFFCQKIETLYSLTEVPHSSVSGHCYSFFSSLLYYSCSWCLLYVESCCVSVSVCGQEREREHGGDVEREFYCFQKFHPFSTRHWSTLLCKNDIYLEATVNTSTHISLPCITFNCLNM